MINSILTQKQLEKQLIIAEAPGYNSRFWRNRTLTLNDFIKKLETPERIAINYAEFMALSDDEQKPIKNSSGYVGGKLIKNGPRQKKTVKYRYMLTLDYDNVPANFPEIIAQKLKGIIYILHSTMRHGPNNYRYRLIIFLSSEVEGKYYESLARQIVNEIGLEVDSSCLTPEHFMYYPKLTSDGDYFFKFNDNGELLDPANYKLQEDETISTEHETHEIDTERIVDIDDFLRWAKNQTNSDTILKLWYGDWQGIEKYKGKTSSSEPRFVFINYAIQYCGRNAEKIAALCKASGMNCKKWDDRPTLLKSEINKALITHKKDFPLVNLAYDQKGKIKNTIENAVLVIEHDPKLAGIAYNLHCGRIDVREDSPLPWSRFAHGWEDSDDSNLRGYFEKFYGLWHATKIQDALNIVSLRRAFHPIREYLDNLPEWDGDPRVDTLLVDYLGAEDNIYTRAVTRKTLCAAVARIYEPGIKFDNMLVLIGPQGIGKSTLFIKLCGPDYFSDNLSATDMADKTAAEQLQNIWIIEMAELNNLRKAEVESVKSFLSRQADKFRPAYGRNVVERPRQSIIVGSTNSQEGFLRDTTGNRRFWPVKVAIRSYTPPWELKDVDQIWSEAVLFYKLGETLFLTGDEFQISLTEQQKALESDDREGLITEYLDTLLPENWYNLTISERRGFLNGDFDASVCTMLRVKVCPMEIWCECFGKSKEDLKRPESNDIVRILSKIDRWQKYMGNHDGKMKFGKLYGLQRAFVRKELKT